MEACRKAISDCRLPASARVGASALVLNRCENPWQSSRCQACATGALRVPCRSDRYLLLCFFMGFPANFPCVHVVAQANTLLHTRGIFAVQASRTARTHWSTRPAPSCFATAEATWARRCASVAERDPLPGGQRCPCGPHFR